MAGREAKLLCICFYHIGAFLSSERRSGTGDRTMDLLVPRGSYPVRGRVSYLFFLRFFLRIRVTGV